MLQLVVFMHAGETEDKWIIYGKVYFMMFVALVTVFGTLFIFLWDM
jgi:cytochrome aa3-600 menaquinol oxidase subunit 4